MKLPEALALEVRATGLGGEEDPHHRAELRELAPDLVRLHERRDAADVDDPAALLLRKDERNER